eukprot:5150978-Pyramimonas_sp.AAC.1
MAAGMLVASLGNSHHGPHSGGRAMTHVFQAPPFLRPVPARMAAGLTPAEGSVGLRSHLARALMRCVPPGWKSTSQPAVAGRLPFLSVPLRR